MAPKKPKKKLSAYNRFIARELKGKTGPGYKGRFKAAVTKWKRSNKSGSKPRAKAKPSSKSKPKASAKPTGGNRGMKFNTQKLYSLMRTGAILLPGAMIAIGPGTPAAKVNHLSRAYFGYDLQTKTFKLEYAKEGWMPGIFATVVTYVVPKIGSFIRGFLK